MKFLNKRLPAHILLRSLATLLLLCVLLWLTAMWWLPAVLPWFLQKWDVEVAGISHTADGGWKLETLVYRSKGLELYVESLQLPSIHTYVAERIAGEYSSATRVSVGKIEQMIAETELEAGGPGAGLRQTVVQVRSLLESLTPWLPEVTLERLVLLKPSGEPWLQGKDLQLQEWELTGSLATIANDLRVTQMRARFDPLLDWTMEAMIEPAGVLVKLDLKASESALSLRSELSSDFGQLEGAALFTEAGWLPAEASLISERLDVPVNWFSSLSSMPDLTVSILGLNWTWKDARYVGSFDLLGSARVAADSMTSLQGTVAFSGDEESVLLEQMDLSSDWAKLHLNAPLSVNLADGSTETSALLRAEIDLSRQSILPASGMAVLEIAAQPPTVRRQASFDYEMRLEAFVYKGKKLGRLKARGSLAGDQLKLERLFWYGLTSRDEALLELSGDLDLSTRALHGQMALDADASAINALMEQPRLVERVVVEGEFSGSLDAPLVELSLQELEIDVPGLEPVRVTGALHYGEGQRMSFDGELACQSAHIETRFSSVWDTQEIVLQFEHLLWQDPERPELRLVAPTTVTYGYANLAASIERRLSVTPFQLKGTDLEAQGSLGRASGASLSMRGVSLARLDRWVEASLPAYVINRIDLQITHWLPSIRGQINILMEEVLSEQERLHLDLQAELGTTGVNLTRVDLRLNDALLLTGEMRAPISLHLPDRIGESPFIWDAGGRLEGRLLGGTSVEFVDWMETKHGVLIKQGDLELNIAGSLNQPKGALNIALDSLVFQEKIGGQEMPALDTLRLQATFAHETVSLDAFQFLVNDSPVSGRLSVPTRKLADYIALDASDPVKLFEHASGELNLSDWNVGNWSTLLPPVLRRSGSIDGSLALEPGYEWSGELIVQDLALRPTQTMPSVDRISGRLRLDKSMIFFDAASAHMGGSPVEFDGKVDLSSRSNPLWFFTAKGSNVPLVRTPDMILRSDVDLRVEQAQDGSPPLLSGVLALRPSTLLVEFDPLAPAVESGPARRPPFFSIMEMPFADWRFDLELNGDAFMRVRSPYFRAELSADFALGGTFAEPELVGQARTVDGELRFPGAKMQLDQGEAFIEAGRLDALQLNVSGIAQKANYVITMEVSQTMANPQIQFQSTPELSNAAILRLLSTGSTQGGGVGSVGLYLGQGLLGAGGMNESFVEKFTIDVGEETTRSGKNTVGVRYDLLNNLYLNGGYDVYDAYNLDLVWGLFMR